jgi:hypothetical protein
MRGYPYFLYNRLVERLHKGANKMHIRGTSLPIGLGTRHGFESFNNLGRACAGRGTELVSNSDLKHDDKAPRDLVSENALDTIAKHDNLKQTCGGTPPSSNVV